MGQNRFYTLVGIFALGSLALMLFGGTLAYKNHLQSKIQTYVMFFKGSLKGLDVSTPVTYRGVKIGQVHSIEITENKAGNHVIIPVYVEFYVEKRSSFSKNPIHLLILNGFVADIGKPNFLTGISDIEIIQLKQIPKQIKQTYYQKYPVFPTRNTVHKVVSLGDTLKAARRMFNTINDLVQSKEMHQTIDSTKSMVDSVNALSQKIDLYLPSVVAYLNQSLKNISDAAESTQNLTDYLSRNPESLLRGRQ
jgi:ABC-type transporter Mla subunit MlaD